ncbi:MAG: tripartite tricarboxylate transporter substrate binding protein, partial [Burkholderiales bacterium]|nr:tripartite tricarboxylate transporter substrate binding protein [Burkholderiales bacterium]
MRISGTRCLLAIAALSSTPVIAQDFPAKPIRIVVPTAPAGSPDVLARLLAERLRDRWGQPVVIENRAGAGQMIGAEMVAKAPADGYTLLLPTGTYTTSVAVRPSLPFDPVRD